MNHSSQTTDHRPTRILITDNVRSLHNIGSFFRTCDAFGMDEIYLCGVSATPPRKEISKTALGAENRVAWKYFETTLEALVEAKAQGCQILALEIASNSVPLQKFKAQDSWALIVGHEILGVDAEVMKRCDAVLEIPLTGTKESLNVSVAAGIGVWELVKG